MNGRARVGVFLVLGFAGLSAILHLARALSLGPNFRWAVHRDRYASPGSGGCPYRGDRDASAARGGGATRPCGGRVASSRRRPKRTTAGPCGHERAARIVARGKARGAGP